MIDNKLEKLFPPAMRAAGLIPILFGILLLLGQSYIAAIIFFIIGSFIAFADNGILLDPVGKRSKQYIGFVGLKMGKWKSMQQYCHITILRSRESTTAYSRSNRATTTSAEIYYDVTLLDKTHRQKLGVKRFKGEQQAVAYSKRLMKALNFDFVKYNPEVSEKTRANRRKGRAR